MKRFLYETLVVAVCLTLVGWYQLTRRPHLVAEVWAELQGELCEGGR